jgi:GNAT superfamily N-acetyltransferase
MRREVRIRHARPEDEPFVLDTSARLAAFGPPAWRTAAELVEGERRTLRAYFASPPPGAALLVAEADDDGGPLGFVYLESQIDYFTQERHGHVGIIAVSAAAEGSGAGRTLMTAAEDWARAQGFARLTLNVFDGNDRARRLYERAGFLPETIRYTRMLR